jgi:hypothetical protein
MPKQTGDLMRTFVSAFQDAHLGTSDHRGIPFVRDETAQSHLFRIIDFLNPEIWDDHFTSAISREVILTLLQCAARLYEGGVLTKEAVDLIESEETRAILSIGIQDNLAQVIHQRCVENIISNKSEATNTENCFQQVGLFSAIRKNKARRLNNQALVIEHISALCHLHSAALQNTFDSPRIDEQFMFRHYITLSKALNVCEKSWLVTLLPDTFQWESQSPCSDANRSNDTLLAPSLTSIRATNEDIGTNQSETITSLQDAIAPYVIQGANQDPDTSRETPDSLDIVDFYRSDSWGPGASDSVSSNKLVSPPSHDSVIISDELKCRITLETYKDIQEAFRFTDTSTPSTSTPSTSTTNGDVQHWPGKGTTEESNELLRICDNLQHRHLYSEFSALTNAVLEFEKWKQLPQKRVMTNCNLASVEAVASVLKAATEFRNQARYEREESIFTSKKNDKEDARNYNKALKNGVLSSLGDTQDGDWNFLESDDDSDCIFPFSPPACNRALNRNVSTPSPHGAEISTKLYERIPVANLGNQVGDYRKKGVLKPIFEVEE